MTQDLEVLLVEKKIEGSASTITCLGIKMDTVVEAVCLLENKLTELKGRIR